MKKLTDFEPVSSLDFEEIEQPSRSVLPLAFKTKTVEEPKPIRLGTWAIEAQFGYGLFIDNPQGLRAGLGLIRKFSPLFSAGLGIDFRRFHNFLEDYHSNSQGSRYSFGSVIIADFQLVHRLFYITPNYFLALNKNRSRFSAGAGVHILTAVKVKNVHYVKQYFQPLQTSERQYFIKDPHLGRILPEIFAGYDFQIHKNFRLGLKIEVPLRGMRSSSYVSYLLEVEDTPFLEIHAAYTLFKSKK